MPVHPIASQIVWGAVLLSALIKKGQALDVFDKVCSSIVDVAKSADEICNIQYPRNCRNEEKCYDGWAPWCNPFNVVCDLGSLCDGFSPAIFNNLEAECKCMSLMNELLLESVVASGENGFTDVSGRLAKVVGDMVGCRVDGVCGTKEKDNALDDLLSQDSNVQVVVGPEIGIEYYSALAGCATVPGCAPQGLLDLLVILNKDVISLVKKTADVLQKHILDTLMSPIEELYRSIEKLEQDLLMPAPTCSNADDEYKATNDAYNKAKETLTSTFDEMKSAWSDIKNAVDTFSKAVDIIKNIPTSLVGIVTDVLSSLTNGDGKGAIFGAIDFVRDGRLEDAFDNMRSASQFLSSFDDKVDDFKRQSEDLVAKAKDLANAATVVNRQTETEQCTQLPISELETILQRFAGGTFNAVRGKVQELATGGIGEFFLACVYLVGTFPNCLPMFSIPLPDIPKVQVAVLAYNCEMPVEMDLPCFEGGTPPKVDICYFKETIPLPNEYIPYVKLTFRKAGYDFSGILGDQRSLGLLDAPAERPAAAVCVDSIERLVNSECRWYPKRPIALIIDAGSPPPLSASPAGFAGYGQNFDQVITLTAAGGDTCETKLTLKNTPPVAKCESIVPRVDSKCTWVATSAPLEELLGGGSSDTEGPLKSLSLSRTPPFGFNDDTADLIHAPFVGFNEYTTDLDHEVAVTVCDMCDTCRECVAEVHLVNDPPVANCQTITKPVNSGCAWDPKVSMENVPALVGRYSTDREGDVLLSVSNEGPFAGDIVSRTHNIDLTAQDACLESSSCPAFVVVVNSAPVARCRNIEALVDDECKWVPETPLEDLVDDNSYDIERLGL